jgi:sulfatase maturation enzyme AslB (radical SAM superfamily)
LRGEGSHAEVVKAIELARARDLPTYLVMVVSRRNFGDMEAMLQFCEARGVRMHAQPVLFGREVFDETARDLALSEVQLRSMHQQLADWKRAGRPLMFAARPYENVTKWPDPSILTPTSAGDSDCMAGKSYVHVEPNGDLWPCSQHGADYRPKNVLRDGLDEALAHVQHHNCGDCFTVYLNERKAVFGLRPAALWEMAKRG